MAELLRDSTQSEKDIQNVHKKGLFPQSLVVGKNTFFVDTQKGF